VAARPPLAAQHPAAQHPAAQHFNLANLRDWDYHWLAPLQFTAGQRVTVVVTCTTPGERREQCGASATFSGRFVGP
jgi:hypothetical protein